MPRYQTDLAVRDKPGLVHVDSSGQFYAAPVWGGASDRLNIYDYDFGAEALSVTDSTWGISGFVTIDTATLRRGDTWVRSGYVRMTVLEGRLLFQTSQDLTSNQIGARALTYLSDDAVIQQFSFDASDDTGTGASSIIFVWGADNGSGNVDTSNCFQIEIDNYDGDTWLITYTFVIAGVGADQYSNAIESFGCPWNYIAIEGHAGQYRAWAGASLQSMHRIGPDVTSTVHPLLFGIFAATSGRAVRTPYPNNPTWGLGTFRRRSTVNA